MASLGIFNDPSGPLATSNLNFTAIEDAAISDETEFNNLFGELGFTDTTAPVNTIPTIYITVIARQAAAELALAGGAIAAVAVSHSSQKRWQTKMRGIRLATRYATDNCRTI